MLYNSWYKKEEPVRGVTGLGGGATALLVSGNPPGFQTHDCMPILQTNASGSAATDGTNSLCNDDAHAAYLKLAISGWNQIGGDNEPKDVHDQVEGSSGSALTINTNGNTVSGSTTQSKWYGKSWYLPHAESGSDLQAWVANPLKDIGTGDYTIEFWMRRTEGTLLFDGTQDSNVYFYCYSTNLDMYTNTSCQTDAGVYSDNTWHHVAFVRNGSNKYIYVDGSREKSCVESSFSMSGGTNLAIGSRVTGADDWKGYMNDIRIYTTAKYTGASFTIFGS